MKKTKTLAPSRKGVALISILPKIIQSPVTTAEFMADIEKVIRSLIDKYVLFSVYIVMKNKLKE